MKFPNHRQGKPNTFDFNDSVITIDQQLYSSQDGIVIPFRKLKKIGTYSWDMEDIQFEMKIVSEKLDEIAKDENVESGVEDSEPEHEKVESGVEDSETEEK